MTDSDDDERDDLDDEEEESSPPPPKAKAKTSARSGPASKKSVSAAPKPAMVPSSRAIAIGVIALAVGGAGGWFGQIQKTKAAIHAEGAAAPAGSGVPAGPCGAWQTKICSSAGEQSASCQEAKGATELLVPSTCEAALGTMPATLAKLKAARASCDKLVGKLCADLTPGSKTCDMVKERTPSFPRERCDSMLQNYDKVIAELRQMDQQNGMQMGGGPQMGAPGGAPRMPPGMPRITMPPGVSQPGSSQP
jgi:hypothetical protein